MLVLWLLWLCLVRTVFVVVVCVGQLVCLCLLCVVMLCYVYGYASDSEDVSVRLWCGVCRCRYRFDLLCGFEFGCCMFLILYYDPVCV